jgi:HlyD family secretion protein
MNSGKLLKYAGIIAIIFIVFAIIGKKAGWFGKEIQYKIAVEKAQKRTIVEIITANGKIQPETEVKMTPEVSGEIIELNVKEGEAVNQGQILGKIRPDTYISARDRAIAAVNNSKASLANIKAMLGQVEARFNQTELSYKRNKKLWEQKTISQSEWESADASYQSAKAEIEAAKQNVNSAEFMIKSSEASLKEANENLIKTTLYAPMTGTISMLNVEKGEKVVGTNLMSGTEMMRIANLDRMEVKVDVNENDIVRVKLGDTALIEVDAYLGEKFKGVVTEIANSATSTAAASADQVTNFQVKVLLLKESYKHLTDKGIKFPFRPGMSATVEIQTETKYNILTIPIQAVTTRTDSVLITEVGKDTSIVKWTRGKKDNLVEVIFVVKENKLRITPVKTGIQDNNYIELTSEINKNDQIVIGPFSAISKKLKHGSIVKIVDSKDLFKEEK